jgi:diguanylate cyclase (GGDEF)-like protein
LVADDDLVGVLALYSAEPNGFNDDHKRIIEAIGRQIAHTFKSAAEFDGNARRDALTGLPNLRQLEMFIDAGMGRPIDLTPAITLLFIDIVELKQINASYGRTVGDSILRHVAGHVMAGLRLADILFRCGSDEFVALLNDTSPEAAGVIGARIRDAVAAAPFPSDAEGLIGVDITPVVVAWPTDGVSLSAVIDRARAKTGHASFGRTDVSTIR